MLSLYVSSTTPTYQPDLPMTLADVTTTLRVGVEPFRITPLVGVYKGTEEFSVRLDFDSARYGADMIGQVAVRIGKALDQESVLMVSHDPFDGGAPAYLVQGSAEYLGREYDNYSRAIAGNAAHTYVGMDDTHAGSAPSHYSNLIFA